MQNTMRTFIWPIVVVVLLSPSVNAVTIDFDDGFSHTALATNLYSNFGLTMPNMRMHQSTAPGALAFPFIDGWGIVIDGGLTVDPNIPGQDGGTLAPGGLFYDGFSGIFQFESPVDFVSMDVSVQVVEGTIANWNLRTFDSVGQPTGFEVASIPNNTLGTLLLNSSLTVTAPGGISLVVLNRTNKIGVDTVRFGPAIGPSPTIPEPSTILLVFINLSALVWYQQCCRKPEDVPTPKELAPLLGE